ncbi:cytochrome P450 [Tothia fuscella]|uniref:Cytochrome P450 n=1 Tax=Tothia fuscella TaxID=1048955 RepID=A0A9P4NKP7_9PEZI|nr:cytochrome P450 [Tothia fuscella]
MISHCFFVVHLRERLHGSGHVSPGRGSNAYYGARVAHLILCAATLLVYCVYRWLIYPTFISPLAKIPNAHPTCSIFPVWLWLQQRRGCENASIYRAHEIHGPIVRVGPNEVSVNSLEGVRKVYIGGFQRTEWFQQFRNYDGTSNLVTFFDGKTHSIRKRMLAHFYSKSYLLGSEDLWTLSREILCKRLLPDLNDAADERRGIDVYEMGFAVSAELMAAYIFGVQNGMDTTRKGTEKQRRHYLELSKIKMNRLKNSKNAVKELELHCFEMCQKTEQALEQELEKKPTLDSVITNPVIYTQLRASIPATEGITNEVEVRRLIASEVIDSIEAARENCGITLTYVMWQLSKRVDLQSQLRDELASLQSSFSQHSEQLFTSHTLQELDRCSLLDAIVKETLRCHPPAPGSQRRLSPKGGTVIEGYEIPFGVIVSLSPYTMHRNESVYPNAHDFKPERWLQVRGTADDQRYVDGEDEKSGDTQNPLQNELRKWFLVFGQGGRMCIGSNFALLVLKLLLASIYTNFDTYIIDEGNTQQKDGIMGGPIGEKLVLGFTHVR